MCHEFFLKGFDCSFLDLRSNEDDALDSDNSIDSNAFWVIENEESGNGGPIVVGLLQDQAQHRIKLRHFNSGRYLYMRNDKRLQNVAMNVCVLT
jgi:hypothetical protein